MEPSHQISSAMSNEVIAAGKVHAYYIKVG